jgi:hypothetical protein
MINIIQLGNFKTEIIKSPLFNLTPIISLCKKTLIKKHHINSGYYKYENYLIN